MPKVRTPLICRNCGRVANWVSKDVQDHRQVCPRCGRVTQFTVKGGKVEAQLVERKPRPPGQKHRSPQGRETSHEELDRMLRGNRYVDSWRC